MHSCAYLGGSFDPIHLGHIKCLQHLKQQINYEKLCLLPYNVSPTAKRPAVSVEHRLAMLRLALSSYDFLELEEAEIQKETPAYTYDSMKLLRGMHGDSCHLSFVMGDDCYSNFASWHRWDEISKFANLVVVNRQTPEPQIPAEVRAAEQKLKVFVGPESSEEFLACPHGAVLKLTLPLFECSSTALRAKLAGGAGGDTRELLPPQVAEYIAANNLYA